MRYMILSPAAVLAVMGSADSRPRQNELAYAVAGWTAGAEIRCIDPRRLQGPRVIDRQTLAYSEGRGRVWINRLPEECLGLRFDAVPVVQQINSKMCANDIVTPVSPGRIAGGNCRLGSFTPYDRPKR